MLNRTEWGKQHRFCWVCGNTSSLQTHEIARGCHRKAAVKCPSAWMRLCIECHDLMGTNEWPIVRQLALKHSRDPRHYDLLAVNGLRGRPASAITQDEVMQAAEDIMPVPAYLVDEFV